MLRLDSTHAVRVRARNAGRHAEPLTLAGEVWGRSVAGDGAGLALLDRLRNRSAVEPGFRVAAEGWVALEDETEHPMGVDQTNESWVVGGRVVVKWVTDDLSGPHPGPDRMRRLAAAGFDRMPALVGLAEWQNPTGDWAPVAVVTAHLPGAQDGWTWALAEARRSVGVEDGEPHPFATALGDLTAGMHRALVDGAPVPVELATAQAADARATLDLATRLTSVTDPASHQLLVAHRDRIVAAFATLDDVGGSPAVHLHGDLHVGQVLRTPDGALSVIDFDGNPTRPAGLRGAPGPVARDVAGMLMSLENVGHVVRHHAPEVSESAVATWVAETQDEFLSAYVAGLGELRDLYDDALLGALTWEQICREFVYAARHLPAWEYVPAAALRRRTETSGAA